MSKKKKPLNVDTLWQLQRVAGLALSPNGTQAVCSVTRYDMAQNKGSTQLWLLSTAGGKPRQLTHCGEKDGQPAWSPQGDRIAFVAKREQDGKKDETAQLYVMVADGGEARRISSFAPGVEAFKWMPDGKGLVFVAWVWPELKGAKAQAKRHKAFTERKESGYATSEAQYRYFDHNLPAGRVPHLLLLDIASGRITDLLEGSGYELPRDEPGGPHFDISPDGKHIAFACDPQPRKISSNRLALVELDIRKRRFRALTDAPDWDFGAPAYSPDGRTLALLAAHTGPKHTALAQLALLARDSGHWHTLSNNSDRNLNAPLRWSADGTALYFSAEEHGRCHLWRHRLAPAAFELAARGGWVQGFGVAGQPGTPEVVLTALDSANHPVQVFAHDADGQRRRLDNFNDELLARCDLGEVLEHWVTGAQGDAVQLWLTLPPGFKPHKKYPVLHAIHGGPYAASGDTFAYRWNTHVLASQGHVVAQVNYHGSSGFGFAFRDSIMGRMGQLELQDIEAATDWLLQQPWADRQQLFASGGSYGGYLVAWMNGHVPPGRYRAYVCHAGVFDRVATWSADSYTHRPLDLGASYWDDLPKVQAQSPATFAAAMRTPTLVIHGQQDFRVPDHNGLAYYNTLQSLGVDARLLWFPDENHWILKPRNSKQWYGEFFAWLKRHAA
jgi:dipeptidyl aminopeptidase/acylaminoacyl peptidase